MKLLTFKGGVHPQYNKEYSEKKAIEKVESPKVVYIPLQQHIGAPAKAIVKVGDKVKVGDLLVEFDKDKIQKAGYRTVTPIIISNTDSFKDVKVLAKGEINEKAEMISVER